MMAFMLIKSELAKLTADSRELWRSCACMCVFGGHVHRAGVLYSLLVRYQTSRRYLVLVTAGLAAMELTCPHVVWHPSQEYNQHRYLSLRTDTWLGWVAKAKTKNAEV